MNFSGSGRKYPGYDSLYITLDDYICKEHAILPFIGDKDDPSPIQQRKNVHAIAAAVLKVFPPEDLTVFALGRRDVDKWPGFHNSVGLLLLHNSQDRRKCRRLGVCVWATPAEGLSEGEITEKPKWVSYEGELY